MCLQHNCNTELNRFLFNLLFSFNLCLIISRETTKSCLFHFRHIVTMSSVHDDIDKLITDYKVAMIIKKSCPFCRRAKKVLDTYKMSGNDLKIRDIEGDPDGDVIQEYMGRMTGERTVPRVFIEGQCVGGCDQVSAFHKNGELEKMLKSAGAIE